MVKPFELLRVFWPLDSVQPGISGVLVGWRNSDSDVFIASVLENTEVSNLHVALRHSLLGSDFCLGASC